MKIGYSYWGFLADVKMNEKLELLSTPDGNAFYSWSIIKELQSRGNEVICIMPDRDKYAVSELKENAFSAWATKDRYNAYMNMTRLKYNDFSFEDITQTWDDAKLYESDYIIHEWRMPIEGRNTDRNVIGWQPDLFIQNCLIEYCKDHDIKLFIFDLDYKYDSDCNATILELGNKHGNKVYIPFDFSHIADFEINDRTNRENDVIYIGNRYERDWCIDKYIPDGCMIYGDWNESGRDSKERWPNLKFGHRLQTADMHDVYSNAICTILLAKKEYCEQHFMTARIIESVFYGTIPLFIEEYGEETIREYAGKYAELLTVSNKDDVCNKINVLKNSDEYNDIIVYLREHLKKMDVKFFVDKLETLL